MISTVAMTLIPVTASIAAGYGWVKLGRTFDTATIGPLASDLAMPCLIFSALARADMPTSALAWTATAGLACLQTLAVLGFIVLTMSGLSLRTYLPSVTWGNTAFLGIPLASSAFGRDGLLYAVAFSSVSLLFNSIFAQVVTMGRVQLATIFRTTLIYAVLGGAIVAGFHLTLPVWLQRSVSAIGELAIPLTLMMVGGSLARNKPVVLRRAFIFSVARISAGFATGMGVSFAMGLTGAAKYTLVLQCAMPVAALSYVFAQKSNTDPEEVAGLVAVSTWTSAVSIPLMLSAMIGRG